MPFRIPVPERGVRSIRSLCRALFAGALLFAGACVDQPSPLGPNPRLNPALMPQVANEDAPDQLAVAQVVPGFGGYFIDQSGAPTVYLTDPTRRVDAETALAGFLASFGWTAADLRVRQADFTYLQLDAWYRLAWPKALAVAGAVSSDLDEARNRLRFSGVDASVVANITATVAQAGVPTSATVVEVRGPVRRVSTLRDKLRPPYAGYQIQFFPLPASPVVLVCTIGFNAVKDGINSFVTASHCSNVQGGITVRTDYYQPVRGGVLPDPNNFVAFEVDDPEYFTGGECPIARQCRFSDASRAQYGAGQSFINGRIARPALINTILVSDSTPYLTVDALNPTFRIVSKQATPVQGQTLVKVGRTSGWTQGSVVSTCENIDVTDSQITQLCQSLVDAYVDGGDSGSPTFGFNTDGTAFLAGVLWGSSSDLVTGAVQFIFSPLGAVERELGALTATDPLPTGGKKVKKAK